MQVYSLQTLARDVRCLYFNSLYLCISTSSPYLFSFLLWTVQETLLLTVRNRFGAPSTDCLKENTVNTRLQQI